jgi:hypothetical protein
MYEVNIMFLCYVCYGIFIKRHPAMYLRDVFHHVLFFCLLRPFLRLQRALMNPRQYQGSPSGSPLMCVQLFPAECLELPQSRLCIPLHPMHLRGSLSDKRSGMSDKQVGYLRMLHTPSMLPRYAQCMKNKNNARLINATQESKM